MLKTFIISIPVTTPQEQDQYLQERRIRLSRNREREYPYSPLRGDALTSRDQLVGVVIEVEEAEDGHYNVSIEPKQNVFNGRPITIDLLREQFDTIFES